jgi:hypothetical protein
VTILIGSAGSVAELFKQPSHRKNAQAVVRFVISKISPATVLNAVDREILIRSFNFFGGSWLNLSLPHFQKSAGKSINCPIDYPNVGNRRTRQST